MTPSPERHWCSMLGTDAAQDFSPQVLPQACQSGLAASAVGLPARDERHQVLADRHDGRRHAHVGTPRADGDGAARVDHHRCVAGYQRVDQPALGVVAAMRVGHLEPAVERRHERRRRVGQDRGGELVAKAARGDRSRVQPGRQQLRVHPRDARPQHGTRRDERRLVYRRHAVDQPSGRVPAARPAESWPRERNEGRRRGQRRPRACRPRARHLRHGGGTRRREAVHRCRSLPVRPVPHVVHAASPLTRQASSAVAAARRVLRGARRLIIPKPYSQRQAAHVTYRTSRL